jgi:aspartyl-tRNA(Asn)/glutamyl-tRNA(Gln) amidotransferase subunit C
MTKVVVKNSIPVSHIAKLSNIPVTQDEANKLEKEFEDTLAVVGKLSDIDVKGIEPTFQVTGLENVMREDEVDENQMFSQIQALANARETFDGYFVVPQVLSQE